MYRRWSINKKIYIFFKKESNWSNFFLQWSVLQCGHCYCIECVRYMIDQSHGGRKLNVKCPICRETTHEDGISYVNLSCKVYESQKDGTPITVRGSHSTKVEAVVHRLLALRAEEPDVKVLVFSTVTFLFVCCVGTVFYHAIRMS
jgi:hypothetical protein